MIDINIQHIFQSSIVILYNLSKILVEIVKHELQKIDALTSGDKLYIASQLLALSALFFVLKLSLLPALLAGLLIFQLVQSATKLLGKFGITAIISRIIALVLIALIVIASIYLGIMGLTSFVNGESGGIIALLRKMADVVETVISHLPAEVKDYLPNNVIDLQESMAKWLRDNALHLSGIGRNIGVSIIYVLTGMIIGGMIAFNLGHKKSDNIPPLKSLLIERIAHLSDSFRRIVFSQVKISAINTFFTAIFLVVILPMFGVVLPLIKTMIAVTFIVGLLPVIGNLISNTVIVLISLGISHIVAFGALTFLIVIHKFEYFLNAHIIGTNIRSKAWELLLAMLVMETAFGIQGIIAAPIYYSYLKDELSARKLI